jgi:hypothetical protein
MTSRGTLILVRSIWWARREWRERCHWIAAGSDFFPFGTHDLIYVCSETFTSTRRVFARRYPVYITSRRTAEKTLPPAVRRVVCMKGKQGIISSRNVLVMYWNAWRASFTSRCCRCCIVPCCKCGTGRRGLLYSTSRVCLCLRFQTLQFQVFLCLNAGQLDRHRDRLRAGRLRNFGSISVFTAPPSGQFCLERLVTVHRGPRLCLNKS